MKDMRKAKYILLVPFVFWLLVIPITIELYARHHDWFANVVTFLSLGKGVWEFLKLTGYHKRSKKEEKNSQEELEERHYIYHCKRNPGGFARLVIENSEKEAREKTKKEVNVLRQAS